MAALGRNTTFFVIILSSESSTDRADLSLCCDFSHILSMLLVPICLNFRFQLAREHQHPFHVSVLLVRQPLASQIVQGGCRYQDSFLCIAGNKKNQQQ